MRLHLNLLTLGLATSVAVPIVLVLPVASAPAATPHPVAPHEQHVLLKGVDKVAAVAAGVGAGTARVAVLTAAMQVHTFSLVGVAWDRSPAAGTVPTTVQVRTKATDGTWTAWSALETSDASPDLGSAEYARVKPHTEPIITQDSDAVQVRVDTAAGVAPAGLQLDLVDPGTSAADGAVAPTPASSASAAAGIPAIVTRAQWGADESLRDPGFKYTSTVKIAVVHHTASGNSYWQTGGDTLAAAAKDLRAIYAYSVSTGYADVPYNFLVDQAGRIYEGRAGGVDKAVLSAATGGFNTDTMSISALGNFDVAAPSAALVSGIERIAAWKLGLFHRDPTGTTALISAGGGTDRWPVGASVTLNNIAGHRDTGSTACPGRYLYPSLPTIRTVARTLQQSAFYNPVVVPAVVPTPLTTPMTLTTRTSGAMSYQLQVADSTGHAVRTYTGSVPAAQTLSIPWDLNDGAGHRVPDGYYTMTLTGSAAAGPPQPFSTRVQFGSPDVPTAPPLGVQLWTPGYHTVSGMKYYTSCVYPSLQLLRCSVVRYAPYWASRGGSYVSAIGWVAYTTSYVAYDAPLYSALLMSVPGTTTSGGFPWLTQCVPNARTGPRTCWAYRMESQVVRVSGTGSASKFAIVKRWTYKSITSLSARPAP
jgi:N-acetylmuramoyl-L-alanine amidase/FlgD Ig-like domain